MILQKTHTLIIRSRSSELDKVEDFLQGLFHSYNVPDINFNKVLVCISEGICNAIVHGNKGDKDKNVQITVEWVNHVMSVKITDQGEGFNYHNIPDPTRKFNLLKESGRGIHIIKSLAKSFSFNDKGNSLEFQIECAEV